MISIHAPTRGATIKSMRNFLITKFQSTLPREERQSPVGAMFVGNNISIHAPTRGATYPIILYIDKISNFNPRSHERSDE